MFSHCNVRYATCFGLLPAVIATILATVSCDINPTKPVEPAITEPAESPPRFCFTEFEGYAFGLPMTGMLHRFCSPTGDSAITAGRAIVQETMVESDLTAHGFEHSIARCSFVGGNVQLLEDILDVSVTRVVYRNPNHDCLYAVVSVAKAQGLGNHVVQPLELFAGGTSFPIHWSAQDDITYLGHFGSDLLWLRTLPPISRSLQQPICRKFDPNNDLTDWGKCMLMRVAAACTVEAAVCLFSNFLDDDYDCSEGECATSSLSFALECAVMVLMD